MFLNYTDNPQEAEVVTTALKFPRVCFTCVDAHNQPRGTASWSAKHLAVFVLSLAQHLLTLPAPDRQAAYEKLKSTMQGLTFTTGLDGTLVGHKDMLFPHQSSFLTEYIFGPRATAAILKAQIDKGMELERDV